MKNYKFDRTPRKYHLYLLKDFTVFVWMLFIHTRILKFCPAHWSNASKSMRMSPTHSISSAQNITINHPLIVVMRPDYTVLSAFSWEPWSSSHISKVKVPQGEGMLSVSMLLDLGTSCFRHADYSTSLSNIPEKSQVALELCPTCDPSGCLP